VWETSYIPSDIQVFYGGLEMRNERNWLGRAFLGMSLDGFIAREDGDLGWLESLPRNVGHVTTSTDQPALDWERFFPEIDALLMGRSTYEKILTFADWPFPGLPVIVLSRTLQNNDPRVTVVRSVEKSIDVLSARQAREVYVDGGQTVQEFLRRGLIDELTVSIAPVVIGSGKSLFANMSRDITLTVRGSHVTSEGLVRITYNVNRGGGD